MNKRRIILLAVLGCIAVLLTSCRQRLWVMVGQFHQVIMKMDWTVYGKKAPDGVTAFFFNKDGSSKTSVMTSATDPSGMDLYLPSGEYRGVVIDYSPAEYSMQEFINLDNISKARVRALPQDNLPPGCDDLFGPDCFSYVMADYLQYGSSQYTVLCNPEEMAWTAMDMSITSGKYTDYVPYQERESFLSSLQQQEFTARPEPVIEQLEIWVYVTGIYNLYDMEGSLAGMADGFYLAKGVNTDIPCVTWVTGWKTVNTGYNEGYVVVTVNTFGLCGSLRTRKDIPKPAAPADVRLNLHFLLRDRSTVITSHLDCGDKIVSTPDKQKLQLVLGPETVDHPVLPYVDPKDAAGFDADVTPWNPGDHEEITM